MQPKQKKDKKDSLKAHLEVIQSHDVPKNWGLLEASVIARKHSDPRCMELMDAWWNSFARNSRRDQISLIDCLWLMGINPSVIGTLGNNLQRCDMFVQMSHLSPEATGEPVNLTELIQKIKPLQYQK